MQMRMHCTHTHEMSMVESMDHGHWSMHPSLFNFKPQHTSFSPRIINGDEYFLFVHSTTMPLLTSCLSTHTHTHIDKEDDRNYSPFADHFIFYCLIRLLSHSLSLSLCLSLIPIN